MTRHTHYADASQPASAASPAAPHSSCDVQTSAGTLSARCQACLSRCLEVLGFYAVLTLLGALLGFVLATAIVSLATT